MTVVPLATEVTCVFCLAACLLHYYGNWKKQHLMVTIAAFISWSFSLLIIFTLPLDVSNTYYRQCLRNHEVPSTTLLPTTSVNSTTQINLNLTNYFEQAGFTTVAEPEHDDVRDQTSYIANEVCKKPWSWVPEHVLPTFWRVVYWTSQVLTWLLIPMMQSYARAGDFTVLGKLKTALIENAIFYGTYLLIFGVCLIYLAIRPDIKLDWASLQVIGITASNTWGLTLLVLMWGYGLVEVPRKIWQGSQRGRMLQYSYFKIAKLSVEKTEAEENFEDAQDDVKRAAESIKYNNPLRKHVETILEKCPEETREQVMRTTREDYQDFNNPTSTPSEKNLIKLHKKVIETSQVHQRTKCQWNRFIDRALKQEEVAASENSSRREFKRSQPYTGCCKSCYSPKLEWYWKCCVHPWSLRGLSIVVITLSLMVVWSECLFFISEPVLSIFAQFVQQAARVQNYFAIEFVCFTTMAYLGACAFFTVFKVRFFNYYYLAGHHQTNEYSLLFCGMMMCRLTPPLCLNFLGLIHLDSHITQDPDIEETSFTQIMGHMDVIKFISSGFNIYFPIAIVLLCIATFFNLCTHALQCLGFQQFVGDDEMTADLVDEGKNLVSRERRKAERIEETASRRRDWNERFSSRSTAADSRGTTQFDSSTTTESQAASSGAEALGAAASRYRASEYGSNRPATTLDRTVHDLRNRGNASDDGTTSAAVAGGANSGESGGDAAGLSALGRFRKLFGKKEVPQASVQNLEEGSNGNERIQCEDQSVYSVTDGKATKARSPTKNDRSELLRDAEPMAYSSSHDPFADDENYDDLAVHSGYQSRAGRPSTFNSGGRNAGGSGSRTAAGIFDDI